MASILVQSRDSITADRKISDWSSAQELLERRRRENTKTTEGKQVDLQDSAASRRPSVAYDELSDVDLLTTQSR